MNELEQRDQRAPVGGEWKDVIEVLHSLANTITVRSHYSEGHPAIAQADDNAAAGFARVLERVPELVVAIIENEFVVCERPLPDLRARLHVLADAMLRHQIECIVFQRGMTRPECGFLGATLAMPADTAPGRVREHAQAYLKNVLLRFAGLVNDEALAGAGPQSGSFIPHVLDALVNAARALATDAPLDKLGILAIANQIVHFCTARAVDVQQRAWTRSIDDLAAHATNVAMMTAAMAIEAGYQQRTCVDAAAAAILHDIGHLLLPEEIRGVPEPLLDERARPVFRNHTFAGAAMLLGAGCSPLWVAAAFEHHRGVDGEGYPALEAKDPPHELVRIIALANFYDRKRTRLHGRASEPEEALQAALGLEERYFGKPLLRRFLRVLGVYPPGTTVELSNKQPAIVTRANPSDPWRPQVKFLRGANTGKHAELRELDVKEGRHHLSIVRAIAPPLMLPSDASTALSIAPPPKAKAKAVSLQSGETVDEDSLVLRAGARIVHEAPDEPLATGPTAVDKARAELGMDAILDDLLSLPSDALSAMPPAKSMPPPVVPPMTRAPAVAPSQHPQQPPMRPPSQSPQQPPMRPPSQYPQQPPMRPSSPYPQQPVRPSSQYPQQPVRPSSQYPQPPVRPSSQYPEPPLRPSSQYPQQPYARPPSQVPQQSLTRPPPDFAGPKPARHPSELDPARRAPTAPPIVNAYASSEDARMIEQRYVVRLGSLDRIPMLVPAMVAQVALDAKTGFILTRIDNRATFEEIVDGSGLPRIEVLEILDELLTRGAITFE